jgi:hypothetical protein
MAPDRASGAGHDQSARVQIDRVAPRLSPGAGADTQREDELRLDHDWDPRFAPSAAGNQAAWPLQLQHDHEMTELKWISFQREPREYPI